MLIRLASWTVFWAAFSALLASACVAVVQRYPPHLFLPIRVLKSAPLFAPIILAVIAIIVMLCSRRKSLAPAIAPLILLVALVAIATIEAAKQSHTIGENIAWLFAEPAIPVTIGISFLMGWIPARYCYQSFKSSPLTGATKVRVK